MSPPLRRWLFLAHRWLGVFACLFFAMWFASGMVMMYVGYPKLTPEERLAHLPPLDPGAAYLRPAEALRAAGLDGAGAVEALRLAAASGGRAVYLATLPAAPGAEGPHAHRQRRTVALDAATGSRLPPPDARHALASAAAFAGPGVAADYLGTVREDAYTHVRGMDPHRPLHRVRLHDADGTLLYVSGTTGEVVSEASRAERLWNFAGAWIHWLYPFRGNAFDRYWADIVNGIAIACTVAALTGTAVGLLRWRFARPYRSGRRSPYPAGAMRWHHLAGLCFALTTTAWIFSGLMSMNPWKIFDTGAPPLRVEAMLGGRLRFGSGDATPGALLAAADGPVRELRWLRAPGQDAVLLQGAAGGPRLADSRTGRPWTLDADALRQAVPRLLDAPVARISLLRGYDLYYYARAPHTMNGGAARPLPVLRVAFDDAQASWVHVDAATGEVLGRLDRGGRASRWLFAMLHSWDWLPLLARRPLWDALLLLASAGGLAMGLTGAVVGWRRLGLKLRRVAPPPVRRGQAA